MGRENKKEAVAALHRERILQASEKLFLRKGFAQTTVDDISRESEYSRRTVYAYFESKDDILYHLVEKGLVKLMLDLERAVRAGEDFPDTYGRICTAVRRFRSDYPYSMDCVNRADAGRLCTENGSAAVSRILLLGTGINELLAGWIADGQKKGIVRRDVIPMLTVYVLWSGLTALLDLCRSKGAVISGQFSVSENEFLDYGFRQLLNSILEERI